MCKNLAQCFPVSCLSCPLSQLPLTDNCSGVDWGPPGHLVEYIPGETGLSDGQDVQYPRGPALLCLCRIHIIAHWSVLVRVDVLPLCSLDCTVTRAGMCYYGHLFDLPSHFQLSRGHVPPLCQFGHCRTIVLYVHVGSPFSLDKTNRQAGRNILGGVFPLVANAMFTNLGYPAASSLLGGIVSPYLVSLVISIHCQSLMRCRQFY